MNRETIRSLIRPFFIALGLSTMVGSGCYVGQSWLWALPYHIDISSNNERHAYATLATNAAAAFYPVVAGCFVFTFALTARAPSRRSPA